MDNQKNLTPRIINHFPLISKHMPNFFMTKIIGSKLKNGRLSNLPIESFELIFFNVLFRRFSMCQRHITSHSPNRSPCYYKFFPKKILIMARYRLNTTKYILKSPEKNLKNAKIEQSDIIHFIRPPGGRFHVKGLRKKVNVKKNFFDEM